MTLDRVERGGGPDNVDLKVLDVAPVVITDRTQGVKGEVKKASQVADLDKSLVDPVANWVPGEGRWYCGYME